MKWILVRHGQTQGNLERRYIGCKTDEPLCERGIEALKRISVPPVARVFISPLLRCRQSAALLYPDHEPIVVDDLRECDFGAFEGKNYAELNGEAAYQAWIDSGGELPFPGGESRQSFAKRCVAAFDALRAANRDVDCAVIAHGGTLMAIMEKYARPVGQYFDFQVGCGEGFVLREDGGYEKLSAPAAP